MLLWNAGSFIRGRREEQNTHLISSPATKPSSLKGPLVSGPEIGLPDVYLPTANSLTDFD